jgi:hypothetical protein
MNVALEASKAHPVIKRILRSCFPSWKGRKVKIDLHNSVTRYVEGGGTREDDKLYAFSIGDRCTSLPQPHPFRGEPTVVHEAQRGSAIVTHGMFMGKDSGVTITVAPLGFELDVAVDALSEGKKEAAEEVLRPHVRNENELNFWLYVAELEAKRRSGEAPAGRRGKKTAAQLDAEIAAVNPLWKLVR